MAQVNDWRWLEDFSDMNKDLGFAESTLTQQRTILLSREGEIKAFPALGVALEDYLNSPDQNAMNYAIKTNLENDGQTVESITGTAENLTVNASYNS